ncbi:hypothetical protein B0H10DRAFT_1954662 [Mycena sp. CBHHK59/15]|nr:hypothetical protein B0H10DRAFT_1954662 [Mycena sp. CBHHK59/15]
MCRFSCGFLIFDILQFMDSATLKDIHMPQINLQLKWHRLQELETDEKTQILVLSKLNKTQTAEVIVAALGCWLPRVKSREVPQLGHQVPEPLVSEEKIVELEEEEEDADQD